MKKTGLILGLLLIAGMGFATTINIPADYSTIQEGLNTAIEGDTVLVATGTYYENITWPATNGIKLIGSSEENCIIDGNENGRVIYFGSSNIDTTTVINGFTLQNGTADAGGGISCLDASPKLENCIITNNEGGGCAFTNSSAVMRDSEIRGKC